VEKAITETPNPSSTDARSPGFGAQAGYNYQWGNFVFGIEADATFSSLNFPDEKTGSFQPLGTVRPRIGYDFNGFVMPYATGGVAYARRISGQTFDGVSGSIHSFGYAFGGGAAVRINDQWSAFAEYLRMSLLEQEFTEQFKIETNHSHLRIGVNYHPGEPSPISSYRQAQPPDWTGFHFGIHGGSASGRLFTTDIEGPLVGGQAGYDFQFGRAVFGLESDLALLGAHGMSGGVQGDQAVDKLGTARVRLGYDFSGFLPYVSGGAAYGSYSNTNSYSIFTQSLFGYVFGGGLAIRLNPRWSGFVEALRVDADGYNVDTNFTLVRGGLNFYPR
jgi:outer membrane immunogenic protein